MRMAKLTAASVVLLAALVGRAGDSVPLTIDLRETRNIDSLTLNWDASWVGGDASATVVIADNGVEVKRTTGVGEFEYEPADVGRHELTYTTYIDGDAQDEVYRAFFYKGKYTIHFDSNGGEGTMEDESLWLGIPGWLSSNSFSRTGYDFTGWATAVDGTAEYGDKALVTNLTDVANAAIDLYAVWSPIQYEVRFNANGGSGSMATQILTYDTAASLISNTFTKVGYSFAGWAMEADGDVIYNDGAEVLNLASENNAIVDLYAIWAPNEYEVTFDALGGVMDGSTAETVAFDTKYGELPTVTRSGYTFSGWKLGDEVITSNTIVKTANDHTLVAQWTANEYEVTFDVVGGVMDGGPAETVAFDAKYGELPTATRSGYTFSGWKFGDEVITSNTIVKTANDHTLVAQWTANEYEVSFDAAGGVIDGASGALWITCPVTYDAEYSELPAATREGYTFVGWALNGVDVTADTVVKTANDHTLVAQWTANEYEVTFDAAGGDVETASKAVMYDAVYGELPTASHEGYVFLGWTLDGTDMTADTIVETAANHSLTAKWGIQIGNGIWATTICDEPITFGKPLVPPSGEIVVPATIAGRPVVGIPAAAFAGTEAVTRLTIPASVTNIEVGALGTIPATVIINDDTQTIQDAVKANVRKVVFAEGVTKIEDNFFDGCLNLETFDIAEGVFRIGANVFEAANALETEVSNGLMLYQGWCLGVADDESATATHIHIPEGVRGIAAGAFEGEWEIETVEFPSTLRFVGARAFKDCTSIDDICLPNGVVAVDREAFHNCTYVFDLSLPETLKEIGDGAFANCTMLIALTIQEGVVDIGEEAFSNCWRVTSVAIPTSVTNVGAGAFASCKKIASATVPLGLATMAELFPAAYDKITSVSVDDGNVAVQMLPGMFRGCAALKSIAWPEGLSEIAEEAFVGCASMASFDLPDTVTNIGARAFKDLAQLTEIVVPGSVVSLGEEVFKGCSSLVTISLSRRLTALPTGTFAGCSALEEVIVPESVVSVGDGVFSGCTQLQSVRFVGNAPACTAAVYDGTSASLVTYAAKGSRGWDGIPTSKALPEFWPDGTEHEIWSWNPSRFTVSFEMNDGMSLAIEVEQVVGTTFLLPTDVDEVVGKFCGWWTAADGGTRMTESVRVASAESYTAYAHWEFNSYYVRFNANGGQGEMKDQLMTVATRTNLLECAYSRLAYTFVGWAVEPDGEVVYSDVDEVVNLASGQDDVVTLYAKWAANQYMVTFDAVDDVKTVTFDAEYGELPTATRTGYTFNGWKLDDELVTSDMVVKTANDHTLVAQWTANEYTVTFDANGGSVSGPSVTVTYGAAYGELPTATWTGHSFAGWWTAAEGGIQVAAEDIVNVAADHTLCAHWNISFGDTYGFWEEHWQDGWIESGLTKGGFGHVNTNLDGLQPLKVSKFALFEVIGAESKEEICPVVENLGLSGSLSASVLTDEELRQKVMPPLSTAGDWYADGRWIDLRDADDLSGPDGSYWKTFNWQEEFMYQYETDLEWREWPCDMWPGNKSVANRFWVAVEVTSSATNRWHGLEGSIRVWQSGTNIKSEQFYIGHGSDESIPFAADANSLFRGITINTKFACFGFDLCNVEQNSYNTPLHAYWFDAFTDNPGAPLSISLPEAGILYLSTIWYPNIEDVKVTGANRHWSESFSYADDEAWRVYDDMGHDAFFYEYGTHPYGWPGYLAVEVNTRNTVKLELDEDDDDWDSVFRLQFFPKSSKAVAVEASYFSIFDRNRYHRFNEETDWYLQGYVTGTGVYKVGETVALTAVSAPGEAFDHWELKYGNFPDGIDTTNPTLSFTVTEDCAGTAEERKQMVVKAVWKKKHQLTVTTSDITKGHAIGSGFYHAGDPVMLTAVPERGYEFVGWSDGEKAITRTVTATGEDEQYCAHFAVAVGGQDNVTVSFDANGGSVSAPSVTVTYGAAYGELPTATRARYTFDGWKLNDEVIAPDTIVTTANDHTLVAQWTANSYSVHGKTFHVDDIVYSGYIGDEHALEEDEDYLGDVLYVRSKTGEQVAYVTTPWGSYEFHDVTSSSGDITSGAGLFVCTMNSPAGDELHLEFNLAANWADDNGITHSTYFYEASTATKYFMCSGQRYRFGEDGPAFSLLQKDIGTYYLAIDQNSDEPGWAGHDFKSVSRLEDADLVMKVTESGVVTVSGIVDGVAISADCICTCASDSYWETIWVDFVQVVSPGRVAYIEGHLSPIGPSLIAAGINFLDVSSKIYPRVDIIPELAVDSGAAVVDATVDGVGFADEGVKVAIGGSAAEYAAFKEWAGSVKGAGSAGASAAGEAAVVANTNAAAAYLLGAERLFENAPVVEIGDVVVGERTSGTGGSGETGEAGGTAGTGGSEGTGTSISVTVTVKDGEDAVKCAAEKVKAMFEATGDLGDWLGEAKLTPVVTVEEGEGAMMRFKVTPGDGTAPKAFLRIRK